jgi:hypothetical protein
MRTVRSLLHPWLWKCNKFISLEEGVQTGIPIKTLYFHEYPMHFFLRKMRISSGVHEAEQVICLYVMRFAMVHVTRLASLIASTNLTHSLSLSHTQTHARTHARECVNLWPHVKVCDVVSIYDLSQTLKKCNLLKRWKEIYIMLVVGNMLFSHMTRSSSNKQAVRNKWQLGYVASSGMEGDFLLK